MTTKQELVEGILRIAKEGISLGINFNDPRIKTLQERLHQENVCVDDPEFEYFMETQKELENHFKNFTKSKEIDAYTSSPTKSEYDLVLLFPSPRSAEEYLIEAKKDFPGYTFTYTIDPKENILKNSNPMIIY